ncbi:MAG: DUF58 domain-containing protein [Gammaproteobacteria bacterium]|nr:DUF58 domain-containing protein [Gammaproteobacteria bacterium]
MHLSLTSLPHKLHRLLGNERRRAGRNGAVELRQRRIFILPTRYGLLFGMLTFVMLIGATNYNNSTGFLLSFLLIGTALVSMLHAYHNMLRLSFQAGRAGAVFCGEAASFGVVISNGGGPGRLGIGLNLAGQAPVFTDVSAGGRATVELALPTERRGWLPIGTLTVFTRYPLGLFRAWSQLRLDARCLVYPAPAARLDAPARRPGGSARRDHKPGRDEFMGLRADHRGDTPRPVDGKAAARGREMVTKMFCDPLGEELWLDWNDHAAPDTDTRLGLLCRGVLWAEENGYSYGLRLPGAIINAGRGEEHRHRCLQALALYGHPA